MFSGIIQAVTPVSEISRNADSLRIRLPTGFRDLELGESIAVNGVCLTVTESTSEGCADFFLSAETLRSTSLGNLRTGSLVNLERALELGSRLSGHLVQGHVDGVGMLISITPEGESYRLDVGIPSSLSKYCITKGSVAVNGISLTINNIQEEISGASILSLMIIPHTWKATHLHKLQPGDRLNIEVDMMAKYAERLCQSYLAPLIEQ